jgi:hypothetical protein
MLAAHSVLLLASCGGDRVVTTLIIAARCRAIVWIVY